MAHEMVFVFFNFFAFQGENAYKIFSEIILHSKVREQKSVTRNIIANITLNSFINSYYFYK